VKHLSSRTLEELPLPCPPLDEQRQIVDAIEEQFSRLDNAVEGLQRASANLIKLEQQVYAAGFRGEWEWTALGEIADLAGGITKDSKNQGRPGLVEVPYLRVANVQRGHLDLTEVTTIRVTPEKLTALALQPGDVLFNEGGDRDKLGRGWIWDGQIEPCIHQNHVFRARLHPDFDPRFVSWHGNTFGQKWFWDNGKQTTNLASLSLTTLKRFPVPSPPLDEQRRIVSQIERHLSLASAMRTQIASAVRRSSSLRLAILKAAFAGELSDSPAQRVESVA
jgi:type I restriction enzyme, S subunit